MYIILSSFILSAAAHLSHSHIKTLPWFGEAMFFETRLSLHSPGWGHIHHSPTSASGVWDCGKHHQTFLSNFKQSHRLTTLLGENIDMTMGMFNFERLCRLIGWLSGGKGTCYQTWWPEFDSRDPHDRRKELIPEWLWQTIFQNDCVIFQPLQTRVRSQLQHIFICTRTWGSSIWMHWTDVHLCLIVDIFLDLWLYLYYHCCYFSVFFLWAGHGALLCIPGCH